MNKVYIVAGDNGFGNSGTCVFGLYPTEALAKARISQLKADEEGCKYMYFEEVEVGPQGGDFTFYIEG